MGTQAYALVVVARGAPTIRARRREAKKTGPQRERTQIWWHGVHMSRGTLGKSYEDDELPGVIRRTHTQAARKQLNSCTLLNKELTTS